MMQSHPVHILTANRVWDGAADQPIDFGFVEIEGDRIVAVGRASELAQGAQFQDLGDVTLLPGLINSHVHITLNASHTVLNDYLAERDAGIEALMARAKENLGRAVRVGCTTVRDLGTLNDVVFATRSAIRNGNFHGPDIIAAGEGITSPGGHCYFFGVEAQGAGHVRAAVRRQHEAGADVIKIFATGGNLTPGTNPFEPQYSSAELEEAVDEAHKRGLPIASHAHAPEGIRRSITAGVDTIEHCLFETPDGIEFDQRAAETMAEHRIAAVPTMGVGVREFFENPSLIEELPEDGRMIVGRIMSKVPEITGNFRHMWELGVPVIAGNDAGIPDRHFDDYPRDISLLARGDPGIGMGTVEALRSATSDCARALGLSDRGLLAAGKRADLLAVKGNPLERIDDLANTSFVMCAGRAVVDAEAVTKPPSRPR